MKSIPPWYTPEDLRSTVQTAHRERGLSVDEVVDVLIEHEFDTTRNRARTLVEGLLDDLDADGATPAGGPPPEQETVDEPRTVRERFADVADVAYLTEREFARVLGVVLSRYEGSYRTPTAVDDLDVDLFWNRSHVTVGFRTVTRPAGDRVEEAVVRHVARGKTNPPTGRNPSLVGVVTNGEFTEDARSLAAKHGIELFGPDYLAQWFTAAKLTPEVFGAVLEEGEQRESDLDERIAELPPVPDSIRTSDPLGDVEDSSWRDDVETTEPTRRSTGERRIPVEDRRPNPGEHGRLYSDPSDDGDFGAFDDYLDGLTTDGDTR